MCITKGSHCVREKNPSVYHRHCAEAVIELDFSCLNKNCCHLVPRTWYYNVISVVACITWQQLNPDQPLLNTTVTQVRASLKFDWTEFNVYKLLDISPNYTHNSSFLAWFDHINVKLTRKFLFICNIRLTGYRLCCFFDLENCCTGTFIEIKSLYHKVTSLWHT